MNPTLRKALIVVGCIAGGVVALRLFGMAMGWGPPKDAGTAAPPASAPGATQTAAVPDVALAQHVIVDDSPLPPKAGRRVEVRVAALPSAEECAALIARYRRRAAPDGQVSVSIRIRAKGEESDLPVCVENFDGKGVQEGVAKAMLKAFKDATILPLPK